MLACLHMYAHKIHYVREIWGCEALRMVLMMMLRRRIISIAQKYACMCIHICLRVTAIKLSDVHNSRSLSCFYLSCAARHHVTGERRILITIQFCSTKTENCRNHHKVHACPWWRWSVHKTRLQMSKSCCSATLWSFTAEKFANSIIPHCFWLAP